MLYPLSHGPTISKDIVEPMRLQKAQRLAGCIGWDSNPRTRKGTELKSVAFDLSATDALERDSKASKMHLMGLEPTTYG